MQKYSGKFYAGLVLVVISLIIGKITTATFLIYYEDSFLRWMSVFVYFVSWPMLIVGIVWIGTEYAAAIRRYFSVRFYHEHAKRGGKRVVHHTREGTKKVYGHTVKHGKKAVERGHKLRRKVVHHTVHRSKKAVRETGRKLRSKVNSKKKK
tara:strand:+ start:24845 stop:25297 length:453 start_codon:yes stop_codon:yes gene_type:complete